MNKFTFGTYDSSITDGPFQNGSYPSNTAGEIGAKKQLSFPLKELKEYINSTIPIKKVSGSDKAIQLKVTTQGESSGVQEGLIQYSLDGTTWVDTASGGHQIYDEDENQMPQKTKLMFRGTNVYNSGNYTVVEGIEGEQGVSVSSIVQVSESTSSEGLNTWRATLSNGATYDFIVRNGHKGETGDTGPMGDGLVILGTYASLEDLQTAHPVGNEGDVYIVGTSAEANPAYVWDTNDNAWESMGKIRGEKGAKGDTGNTGATGTGIQSITVEESSVSGGNNVVTITLTNGATNTFIIKNGQQGSAGQGIPTGGNAGQHLAKRTSLDYDLQWEDTPTVDQTYDATSVNAQSGVAVASGISSYDNYLTLSVDTTGWNNATIQGEACYNKIVASANAKAGKHPIISLAITKPSTMDAEMEEFAKILQIEEQNAQFLIFATAVPTTAYTLQVKNY